MKPAPPVTKQRAMPLRSLTIEGQIRATIRKSSNWNEILRGSQLACLAVYRNLSHGLKLTGVHDQWAVRETLSPSYAVSVHFAGHPGQKAGAMAVWSLPWRTSTENLPGERGSRLE